MGLTLRFKDREKGYLDIGYGSFHGFRTYIANFENITLENMQGFKTDGVNWNTVKTKLKPLLNHSDCDGQLSIKAISRMLPRLEEILILLGEKLTNEGFDLTNLSQEYSNVECYYYRKLESLIELFKTAVEIEKPIIFC